MRPFHFLALLLVAGCADFTGLDLGGIDDWNLGGGGGPGGPPPVGAIHPLATADVIFRAGSEFQLGAWNRQGTSVVEPSGVFTSGDTLVLTVSATGWAVARTDGYATVWYVVRDSVVASTTLHVGAPAPDAELRVEIHGTGLECLPPYNCLPAGSPIVEGWIGNALDVAGLSLTFHGANGIQATDLISARPLVTTVCQAADDCVSVGQPSLDHVWASGDVVLCLSVTVGDSVPAIGWASPVNPDWEVTWARTGLFVVRQPVYLYVRPMTDAPPSAC